MSKFIPSGIGNKKKWLGKHHSEKTKEKMRQNQLAEKNSNWVGDNIKSLPALHAWVSKRIIKPSICPGCNKRPVLDLTNNGIYDRNLKNWKWLCRKCHMVSDGRLKNLKFIKKGQHLSPNTEFKKGYKIPLTLHTFEARKEAEKCSL